MLRSQRMSLFEESIISAEERDSQIESLLYETENDLYDLENGFISEAAEATHTSIWEKIKKLISTIIEKITSIFKKKSVENVDQNEEIEVDKEDFNNTKSFINNVKKIISTPFEKLGEALKSKKGPLALVIIAITTFALTGIGAATAKTNTEIRSRNKLRIKKKAAIEIMKSSEEELKATQDFISKMENELKKYDNPNFAITKKQKASRNKYNNAKKGIEASKEKAKNAASKSSYMDYQSKLAEKELKAKGAGEEDEKYITYSQMCAKFFSTICSAFNKIITFFSKLIFTASSKVKKMKDDGAKVKAYKKEGFTVDTEF